MTTRIGVITDTHAPEFLPALPPGAKDLLHGVDMIFHCGDITGIEVIRELEEIAPVHAVAGNHDPAGIGLPERRVVEVEGRRFGITHGVRGHPVFDSLLVAGLNTLWWRWFHFSPGYAEYLVRQFDEPLDYLITGHIHRPLRTRAGRTEVFSPGAVYMPKPKLLRWARANGWRPGKRDWVQEVLVRIPTPLPPPAIGLIQVDASGVRTERIELPAFH
jgi:putative phosphoesterase